MRPAWAAGIRASIATIVPMVAGPALGHTEAGLWMGLAGFNVCLADKGGALRVRFRAMCVSLICGSIFSALGGIVGRSMVASVIAIALLSLAAGLARSWGQVATNAGVVALAVYVVSIAYPAPTLLAAVERGGWYAAGGLFALALALLVWRTRPYRTARLAVARALRAIAAHASNRREIIDDARMTLAAVRRGLQGDLPRGERLLDVLETAERAHADPAMLEIIARAVEQERNDELDTIVPSADLAPLIAAARELNDDRARPRQPLHILEPIVNNLTWDSAVLRHALRVAVATAFALSLTSAMHITRAYWVLFSVIVVLQPHTSTTFQKGLQRVGGTIAGGLIAAVLLATIHSPTEMLIVIFIGAGLTVAFLPLNYALYSLFLTPTFVLLAEANATDWHLVWLRMENTLAGAAIAYVAARLLWPSSERGLVRDDLAAALRNLAEYTRCLGECDDRHAAESRRAFFVALQNADASLQRLLGDEATPEVESLMAVMLYARRFTVALTALVNAADDRLRLAPVLNAASQRIARIPWSADVPSARPSRADEDVRAPRLFEALESMERAAARLHSTGTRTQ